ncbi:MAG: DNA cytosine methyltransferase [Chthoniobacterales bacterium]|nr:DNA cytosine methyltransferase [Chthoniobacterales bacterium]
MNELHLFAGAGGGILGGILLGHTCVCAVEIEPYCQQVLLQRQRDGILPKFPIWDDVRTFDGKPWRGLVDVICGGFPCQDISTAGGPNRQGLKGERSGLWREMARIIREMVPRFVLVENSTALSFRGLGIVLSDLSALGFNAEWGAFSAADAGARHERARLWILASRRDSTQNPAIPKRRFYEPSQESLRAFAEGLSPMPDMGRKIDGLAGWMDRLEAIGNGQVPAVAALAWRLLSDE